MVIMPTTAAIAANDQSRLRNASKVNSFIVSARSWLAGCTETPLIDVRAPCRVRASLGRVAAGHTLHDPQVTAQAGSMPSLLNPAGAR